MAGEPKSLKKYRELAEKKGRVEQGVFLVEGEKAISQIASARPEAITEIIAAVAPPPSLYKYPLRNVNQSQFGYISSTQTPQGIAAVVKLPLDVYSAILPAVTGDRILLLEDIQDPGNAGTLIRTAAALGFTGIILTDTSADPFSPKAIQAAAGTVLSVWIRRTGKYLSLVNELKDKDFNIFAAEVRGKDSPAVLANQSKLVLALGNEAAGLSQELLERADYRVRIDIPAEKAESLNVAACGAILMYLSQVKS